MDNKQEFKWTDELAIDWLRYGRSLVNERGNYIGNHKSLDVDFEIWKKSKEHKVEEKVKISIRYHTFGGELVIDSNKIISGEYFPAIKSAIERELNNDTVVEDKIDIDWSPKPVTEKYYTQSEVDAIRKEAFCSGFFKGWYNGCFEEDKAYSNKIGEARYEKWLSSLNPNNNEPLSDSIPTLERQYYVPLAEGGKCPEIPLIPPQESKQDSKEWEILSYKGQLTDFIYTLINNEWIPNNGNSDYAAFENTKEGIENSGCNIHSVKRLSDGEVFSVGDKILWDGDDETPNEIVSFEVRYNGNQMWLSTDNKEGYGQCISDAKKLPLTEQPKQVEKPPLGLIPDFIWKERRLEDIKDAIKRYTEAKMPVPLTWIAEQYEIEHWILRREENKIS